MSDTSLSFEELLRQDRRYKFEAYLFVFEALRYAQTVLGLGRDCESEPPASGQATSPKATNPQELDDDERGPQQHVTGQELCEAIRQYAIDQYGYMAKTVLNCWGIHSTGDFGEIVFSLIRIGKMRKTRDDRREDFDDVYCFDTAFQNEFKITRSKKTS